MRKLTLCALCLTALFLASCHIHEYDAPFLAKFQNMLYTDIQITVSGYGSKTIAPGETVTFRINRSDQSYHYEAETHGESASGAPIGLYVDWNRTREISGDSYLTYLITLEDLFFLRMRNTGNHDLNPLYVNYGLQAQTVDDITIPGNGLLYNTGYYYAYAATRVQSNWLDMPSDYTYWQQGQHFHFPWSENQAITLLNTFKKGASGETSYEAEAKPVSHTSEEPFGADAGVPRGVSGSAH